MWRLEINEDGISSFCKLLDSSGDFHGFTMNESNTQLCSSCEDNFVVAYHCTDCNEDLCEACNQAHKIVKLTRNHTIKTIKLISSDVNESALKICSGCDENMPASYFCENCNENICEACFVAHKKVKLTRNHNVIDIKM